MSAGVVEVALAHLQRCYPDEGCGLFVRSQDRGLEAVALPNQSPEPRTGFQIDESALLAWADRLVGVFHSHPMGGADLSAADRAALSPGGVPLWPSALQLVVDLSGGLPRELALWRWTEAGWRREALSALR